uniref:Uncharacterized protein n=1 Tax=Setaria viridis TaxID=4556 RepID=A0A4U6UTM7_SETVI|nr:hypothetical protein SEVIR_5G438800v2 [Setaria viridis]
MLVLELGMGIGIGSSKCQLFGCPQIQNWKSNSIPPGIHPTLTSSPSIPTQTARYSLKSVFPPPLCLPRTTAPSLHPSSSGNAPPSWRAAPASPPSTGGPPRLPSLCRRTGAGGGEGRAAPPSPVPPSWRAVPTSPPSTGGLPTCRSGRRRRLSPSPGLLQCCGSRRGAATLLFMGRTTLCAVTAARGCRSSGRRPWWKNPNKYQFCFCTSK